MQVCSVGIQVFRCFHRLRPPPPEFASGSALAMFSRAADHLCHYAVILPFSGKPLSIIAAKEFKTTPKVAYIESVLRYVWDSVRMFLHWIETYLTNHC